MEYGDWEVGQTVELYFKGQRSFATVEAVSRRGAAIVNGWRFTAAGSRYQHPEDRIRRCTREEYDARSQKLRDDEIRYQQLKAFREEKSLVRGRLEALNSRLNEENLEAFKAWIDTCPI